MTVARRRFLIGLGLVAALIAWARPSELLQRLGELQPQAVMICAAMIAMAALVGGINLWLLVRHDTQVPLRHFLPAYWTAWAVGLVTPGQVGDLATISIAMHRRGIDWRQVLGRSLLDKAISAALMAAFAAATLWPGTRTYVSSGHALQTLALLLLLTAAAALLVVASARLRRFASSVARHGREVAQAFTGLARRRPLAILLNAALTTVKLLLTGASYVWAFRALGDARLGLLEATQNCAAAGLVAYLPISFNGIGTVEIAGVALFGSLGIPAATIIAAYLVLRVLGMSIAGGGAGLLMLLVRPPISSPSSPQR